MKKANENQNPVVENEQLVSKLDTIKEIIFGNNIKEYETQFNELRTQINQSASKSRDELSATRAELIQTIEQMELRLTKLMEENQKQLMKEIEKLNEQKTDRKQLGKLLISLGTKISN